MKPFHYNQDSLYDITAAILTKKQPSEELIESTEIEEAADTSAIEKIVATLKVGNTTNFGVVKDIGKDSITFKAKDTPLTKMKFSQYKMGSRDLALEKLVKLKEEDDLEESFVSDAEKNTLDSIIKSLNDSQKLLSTRTTLVKRIIDELGGTPEDKKAFERLYDKLDDVIDTLDKIKKQIA